MLWFEPPWLTFMNGESALLAPKTMQCHLYAFPVLWRTERSARWGLRNTAVIIHEHVRPRVSRREEKCFYKHQNALMCLTIITVTVNSTMNVASLSSCKLTIQPCYTKGGGQMWRTINYNFTILYFRFTHLATKRC